MTTHPSPTTLAQTIAAIRPRSHIKVGRQTFSVDGNKVRVQTEGEPDMSMDRRSALIGGEVILEVARRPGFESRPSRNAIEKGERAFIAVAKSIPEQ